MIVPSCLCFHQVFAYFYFYILWFTFSFTKLREKPSAFSHFYLCLRDPFFNINFDSIWSYLVFCVSIRFLPIFTFTSCDSPFLLPNFGQSRGNFFKIDLIGVFYLDRPFNRIFAAGFAVISYYLYFIYFNILWFIFEVIKFQSSISFLPSFESWFYLIVPSSFYFHQLFTYFSGIFCYFTFPTDFSPVSRGILFFDRLNWCNYTKIIDVYCNITIPQLVEIIE